MRGGVNYSQYDFVTSTDRLANPFIQWVKGCLRVNQRAKTIVLTNADATIQSSMDSIAWFQHRAVTRQGGVHTYEWEFWTEVARGSRIEARHLAGILLALDEGDDIVAGWNKGVGIFEGAADLVAIDGQRTVSVLTFGKKSGDFKVES